MRWKHLKTGGFYEILAHALMESSLEPVIVYRKVDGDHVGSTWVRSAAEFMDGRFVPETSTPEVSEERPPGSIPRMAPKIEIGDTVYLDHSTAPPPDILKAWSDNSTLRTVDVIKEIESADSVFLFERNIFFPVKYLKKVQEP